MRVVGVIISTCGGDLSVKRNKETLSEHLGNLVNNCLSVCVCVRVLQLFVHQPDERSCL